MPVNTLRRYKRHYKLQTKPGLNKTQLSEVSSVLGKETLKLVLLEWSESKSDGKFGFSMSKNPPVYVFGAIGAASGV